MLPKIKIEVTEHDRDLIVEGLDNLYDDAAKDGNEERTLKIATLLANIRSAE